MRKRIKLLNKPRKKKKKMRKRIKLLNKPRKKKKKMRKRIKLHEVIDEEEVKNDDDIIFIFSTTYDSIHANLL